jgi:hypothetical protein
MLILLTIIHKNDRNQLENKKSLKFVVIFYVKIYLNGINKKIYIILKTSPLKI